MSLVKKQHLRRPALVLRSESGMTLIELMVVVVVIGIIANIAIPSLMNAVNHADAARVVSDVNVIRTAAYNYYAENRAFPANSAWGTPPPALVDYLPKDFSFVYEDARYRWRAWNQASWSRRTGRGQPILAVQVRSGNADLLASIKGIYSGRKIVAGNRIMIIIE